MDDIFECNLILIFSFENVQSFLYDTFFDLTDKFWQFYFEVLIALRLSIKPLSMRGSHSERGKVVRKFSDKWCWSSTNFLSVYQPHFESKKCHIC